MGVMSSSLCKNSEGAVAPFQIESLENRVDDPVHTGQVDEAHHGTCAAAELYKNPFNDIGGSQLLPKMPRKLENDSPLSRAPTRGHRREDDTIATVTPRRALKCRLGRHQMQVEHPPLMARRNCSRRQSWNKGSVRLL